MKTTTLTPATFTATLASTTQPVLVDFWAEWCGPCKMIAPLLEQVAAEQAGKAVIAKVNVDEAPELAAQFNVTSIPTLIVFKNGQPVQSLVGTQPKSRITAALAAAATN